MCSPVGVGDQAAELAASRLNSTKPAPGKQGETAGGEIDAGLRGTALPAPGARTRPRGALSPSGRRLFARTRPQLVEPRAQAGPASAAARSRGASPPGRRSPAARRAAARRRRRSRPTARRAGGRPCRPARAVRARGRAGRSCCRREAAGSHPAPMPASTASTCSMRWSRSGSAASTTCSSRSASRASISVERNAATSSCGRSRTKPTVSATTRSGVCGSAQPAHGRVERREQLVGDVGIAARERAEQRRLAGVRVADQRDARAPARACARWRPVSRCAARASRASRRACWMRLPIRRRSVSSWVSPGPRRPMPPFWRSRWVQPRTRRVDRCRSCASSTSSLPSALRARCAKMSRMRPARSSTRRPIRRLEIALLAAATARGPRARGRRTPLVRGRGSPRPCRCRRKSAARACVAAAGDRRDRHGARRARERVEFGRVPRRRAAGRVRCGRVSRVRRAQAVRTRVPAGAPAQAVSAGTVAPSSSAPSADGRRTLRAGTTVEMACL